MPRTRIKEELRHYIVCYICVGEMFTWHEIRGSVNSVHERDLEQRGREEGDRTMREEGDRSMREEERDRTMREEGGR